MQLILLKLADGAMMCGVYSRLVSARFVGCFFRHFVGSEFGFEMKDLSLSVQEMCCKRRRVLVVVVVSMFGKKRWCEVGRVLSLRFQMEAKHAVAVAVTSLSGLPTDESPGSLYRQQLHRAKVSRHTDPIFTPLADDIMFLYLLPDR